MVARIVTEFRHSEVIKGNSVQILLGCESCQNMQISKWNGKICKFPALAERTGDKPYYQSSQCHWTSAFHSSLSIIESLFALWPNLPSICWRPGRTCYYFGRSKICPRITVVPIQYLLSILSFDTGQTCAHQQFMRRYNFQVSSESHFRPVKVSMNIDEVAHIQASSCRRNIRKPFM